MEHIRTRPLTEEGQKTLLKWVEDRTIHPLSQAAVSGDSALFLRDQHLCQRASHSDSAQQRCQADPAL